MRKPIIAVMGCVVLSATCLAESFHLKSDKTGKLYGPFEFKDRAKVIIADTSFTLVKPEQAESALETRMKAIRIPEINLRRANIHDVVDFLRHASVDFDKTQEAQGAKGVNIILNLKGTDPPLVTFNARALSLFETMEIVTQVADLRYRIEGNVVVIEPRE